MVERKHPRLSVTRQCALLEVSRASVYYQPAGVSHDEQGADEADGPPIHGYSLLRVAPDDGVAQGAGSSGEPETGAKTDAGHGAEGYLPASQDQSACRQAEGVPLPAARSGDILAQSGVGRGHHLYPHGPRGPIPGGHDGLVQPLCAELAALQYS